MTFLFHNLTIVTLMVEYRLFLVIYVRVFSRMVIETLKTVNEDRKCFRMIGGVLCERTVKEVLPVLENNKDQLSKVIDAVSEQLTKKGSEINEYKEKHNIRIRGQDDISEKDSEEKNVPSKDTTRGNVLVENPA